MIEEMTHKEVIQKRFNKEPIIVYFYTPLCGTCKLANQMLDIALTTLNQRDRPQVVSCNINSMPELAKEWKIQNVPCLVFIRDGKMVHQLLSFRSVDYIYHKIKHFN